MAHSATSAIHSAGRKTGNAKGVLGAVLGLSLLSLGACASDERPRNSGERLSDRGAVIEGYGTNWSDGQESVSKGEESVRKSTRSLAKGEQDLARAREEVAKAEQQISDAYADKAAAEARIADGRRQMSRAEEDYASTRAGPPAIAPQ